MVEVASLEEVSLRDVWKDEARDFTPWLAADPDHLGKALQMDLELEGAEVPVGPFSADIVLRDANTGQRVVVENLLETTDHDHLGKLITYAAGLEAHWAVLVAREFRPEHRTALTWLNSIADEGSGFFGIEIHAVRIGNSPAAVQLKVVVEPDDFSRRARTPTNAVSEVNARYAEWWAEFLPALHDAHPGWSNAQAPPRHYMNFPSGRGGVHYSLNFAWPAGASNYSLRAEVYCEDGETTYQALEAQRSAIEQICDLALQWEPLVGRRASRVAVYRDPVDPADRDSWPNYRDWAIKTLGELRRAFSATINDLPQPCYSLRDWLCQEMVGHIAVMSGTRKVDAEAESEQVEMASRNQSLLGDSIYRLRTPPDVYELQFLRASIWVDWSTVAILFSTFPRTQTPPHFVEKVIERFRKHEHQISHTSPEDDNLESDEVLSILRPDLIDLGFDVEASKKHRDQIMRPVFFGENAKPELQYQIDAWHPEWSTGLEIEAGRGLQGNAIYRDLVQALVMVDLEHLFLAVRQHYYYKGGSSKDYEKTVAVAQALYAHSRVKMPFTLCVLGY